MPNNDDDDVVNVQFCELV